MALLFRAGCILAVLCLVTAQTIQDLDHIISEIYRKTGENATTKNPPSIGEDNGTKTIEDLDHLISEIYRKTGENATTKNPRSTREDKGSNLTLFTTDEGELIEGTGNCTCIPYYLCRTKSYNHSCENYFNVCCVSGDIVELESIVGPVIDI